MVSKNILILFILLFSIICIAPASADTNITNSHINWKGTNWWFSQGARTDPSNCWIDNNGDLHMMLRQIGGVYKGVMLEAPTTCRYGRMTWVAKSNSLNLERKSSIGLFTYYSDSSELDIEINQWYANDWHLFYSNQPASVDGHPDRISYGVPYNSPYLAATNVTYVIEWTPSYIFYNAYLGDGTVLHQWNYTTVEGIPQENHTICMDILPLDNGPGPDSGNPMQIVLSGYTYDPMRPDARFTSSSTTGTTDTTFSFTDTSTGIPKNWQWNFGDGQTSTSKNPTHRYSSAGTYTVTLTAWNAISSDVETKTSYIVVTTGSGATTPVAGFTANSTSGNAPLTVAFTDQSTNTPTSWAWNFGDGSTSASQNPTHTYSSAGTYTVTLTATNAGGSDGEIKNGYVTVSDPGSSTISPYENFIENYNFETWSSGNSGVAPDGWELTGTAPQQLGGNRSSDSAIGSYSYSITGDGTTSIRGHIVQYSGVTSSPAKLSAWVKKTGSATGGVEFFCWNGNDNYKAVFEDQIEADIWTYYEWELTPGTTSNLEIDVYSTLTSTGTWLVDGIALSNTTSITGETESYTDDAIYSNFSYTPSQVFTNSNLITEYATYNLSDYDVSGITATIDGVSKTTYNRNNKIYINTSGLTETSHSVSISASLNANEKPVTDFTANTTYGIAPITIGFTDTSTNSPTSWSWNFGDNGTSTLQNPTHAFSSPGTYGVTLTSTNAAGSDVEAKSSYIVATAGPQTIGQLIRYILSFRWW